MMTIHAEESVRRAQRRSEDGLPSVTVGRVLRLLRRLAHQPGALWPGEVAAISTGLRRLGVGFELMQLVEDGVPQLDVLTVGRGLWVVPVPGEHSAGQLTSLAIAICTRAAAEEMERLVVVLNHRTLGDLPSLIGGRHVHWVVLGG